ITEPTHFSYTTLFRSKGKHGSLLWVLDKTITAMGSRLLKKWIERPLLNQELINERLEIVTGFHTHFMERDSLREELKSIYDLERSEEHTSELQSRFDL